MQALVRNHPEPPYSAAEPHKAAAASEDRHSLVQVGHRNQELEVHILEHRGLHSQEPLPGLDIQDLQAQEELRNQVLEVDIQVLEDLHTQGLMVARHTLVQGPHKLEVVASLGAVRCLRNEKLESNL